MTVSIMTPLSTLTRLVNKKFLRLQKSVKLRLCHKVNDSYNFMALLFHKASKNFTGGAAQNMMNILQDLKSWSGRLSKILFFMLCNFIIMEDVLNFTKKKDCWIIILLKISLLFCNFFYWLIYRTRGVIRRLFSRLKYYYSICCQFTKLFSRLIWHVIDSTIFLLFITRRVPNEWHLLVNK